MNLEKSSTFPLTFALACLYIGATWGGFLLMVISYALSVSAVVGIHGLKDE